MNSCSCDSGLVNLGRPGCDPKGSPTTMLIFVEKYGSTGALNRIDLAVPITEAFLTAKVNNANHKDRWFIAPIHDELTPARSDTQFKTYSNQRKIRTLKGVDSISVLWGGMGPSLAAALDAYRCLEFGVYEVGADGEIKGLLKEDGYVYPTLISAQTFDPIWTPAQNAAPQEVSLKFDIEVTEDINQSVFIPAGDIAVNMLTLEGLRDVYAKLVSITTTVLTIDLYVKTDSTEKVAVEGLVTADFISSSTLTTSKIRNTTDSADIAVVAAESATIPGRYTLTFAAQTSADVLVLFAKKASFDFTPCEDLAIAIP